MNRDERVLSYFDDRLSNREKELFIADLNNDPLLNELFNKYSAFFAESKKLSLPALSDDYSVSVLNKFRTNLNNREVEFSFINILKKFINGALIPALPVILLMFIFSSTINEQPEVDDMFNFSLTSDDKAAIFENDFSSADLYSLNYSHLQDNTEMNINFNSSLQSQFTFSNREKETVAINYGLSEEEMLNSLSDEEVDDLIAKLDKKFEL